MSQKEDQVKDVTNQESYLNKIKEGSDLYKYIKEIPFCILLDDSSSYEDKCMGNLNENTYFWLEEELKLFDRMIDLTRSELLNYFSLDEGWLLYFILFNTSYNIHGVDPKGFIISSVEDYTKYELVPDKKYYKVADTLNEKLEKLTQFQCYTLLELFYAADKKIFIKKDSVTDEDIKYAFLIGDSSSIKDKRRWIKVDLF